MHKVESRWCNSRIKSSNTDWSGQKLYSNYFTSML